MAGQPATKCCCPACGPCNIPKTSQIVVSITSDFATDGTFCSCGNGIDITLNWDNDNGYFEGSATVCGVTGTFRFYCFSFQPDFDYELRISDDDFATFDALFFNDETYTCDPFLILDFFWAHLAAVFPGCNTALITITEVP